MGILRIDDPFPSGVFGDKALIGSLLEQAFGLYCRLKNGERAAKFIGCHQKLNAVDAGRHSKKRKLGPGEQKAVIGFLDAAKRKLAANEMRLIGGAGINSGPCANKAMNGGTEQVRSRAARCELAMIRVLICAR